MTGEPPRYLASKPIDYLGGAAYSSILGTAYPANVSWQATCLASYSSTGSPNRQSRALIPKTLQMYLQLRNCPFRILMIIKSLRLGS